MKAMVVFIPKLLKSPKTPSREPKSPQKSVNTKVMNITNI
jgi:hypothetical protein